jgi:hypothetical protein
MYVEIIKIIVMVRSIHFKVDIYGYIYGLLFLSPENVSYVFAFTLEAIIPSNPRVIKFLHYLIDNYIRNDEAFPPYLWADQSANLNRTTNACESFHSHLRN